MDLTTMKIKPFPIRTNANNESEISSIHSLLVDRNQTLWIGTYTNGAYYYSPFQNDVTMISPKDFPNRNAKSCLYFLYNKVLL